MMSTIPKFTEAHAAVLSGFLSSPKRPKGTMSYPQLAGFLFSMANEPELIPPSEWLPIVFNDRDALYDTQGEAERVLQAMMSLYNDCGRKPAEGLATLPPGCEIRPRPLDNLDAGAPLSQWARGFVMGHTYLDEAWNELTPDSLHHELAVDVMILSFFSSRRLAEAYLKESKGPKDLGKVAGTVISALPDAMNGYAQLGRSIFLARREWEAGETGARRDLKVGRNDPCPCGSGKKFKKCCGAA